MGINGLFPFFDTGSLMTPLISYFRLYLGGMPRTLRSASALATLWLLMNLLPRTVARYAAAPTMGA